MHRLRDQACRQLVLSSQLAMFTFTTKAINYLNLMGSVSHHLHILVHKPGDSPLEEV